MNRVLIITYYWPPSGGAGVQRWLKYVKYLPAYGWEPLVLTVDPACATFPATDESLGKEVPEGIRVFRTKATDWFRIYSKDKSKVPAAGFAINPDKTLKGRISRFIRGNFFIPDPRRGWNRHALRKAGELIREYNIRYIITTSPPHSTQLTGYEIKKRFPEIFWLADLRDAWTDIYYYNDFYPTFISRAIDSSFERKVIKTADVVTTVGFNLREILKNKVKCPDSKFVVIPNGYDEDDFRELDSSSPSRFTITYIGTLAESYPVTAFLDALSDISKSGTDFLLRFVGKTPESIKEQITTRLPSKMVDFMPYVEHREAVNLMVSSSMLLLIIPETRENRAITPGKVFEYIAAGKPVLYVGPHDGDAAWHLKKYPQNGMFDGKDPSPIRDYVMERINKGTDPSGPPPGEYSRRVLAGKFSEIMLKA